MREAARKQGLERAEVEDWRRSSSLAPRNALSSASGAGVGGRSRDPRGTQTGGRSRTLCLQGQNSSQEEQLRERAILDSNQWPSAPESVGRLVRSLPPLTTL